jgi:glutathione S-transferase
MLTLYRDTNGWCPFCERVWVSLMEAGIPFDEVFVDLKDKPDWYKQMVPTTLVPAIRIHDSEEVVWESDEILRRLQPLVAENTAIHPSPAQADLATRLTAECSDLLSKGTGFAYGSRNATEAEVAEKRQAFEKGLDTLESSMQESGANHRRPFAARPRPPLVAGRGRGSGRGSEGGLWVGFRWGLHAGL